MNTIKQSSQKDGAELPKQFRIKPGTRFDTVGSTARAEIAHQSANLRIFRLFALLFAAVMIIGLITAGIVFLRESLNKQKQLEAALAQLNHMEETPPQTTTNDGIPNQYAADLHEVALMTFRTENVMPLAPETLRHKLQQQNDAAAAKMNSRKTPPVIPADGGKGADFICPTAYLEMIGIPKGTFKMGGSLDNEMPAHEVTISSPFWMARTEVTNRQMHALIPGFDAGVWNGYRLNFPDQPAVRVRWDQAVMYCAKITELERASGRLPSGYVYRLPTEAEWEYACRAGTSTNFHWANEFGADGAKYANLLDTRAANHFNWQLKQITDPAPDDGHLVSAGVAGRLPNLWGLYDMSGNAAEWCADWYNAAFYTKDTAVDPYARNPVNTAYTRFRNYDAGTWTTETACRVIRGGSWGVEPKKARSAYRDFMPPNEADTGTGFRPVLARDISVAPQN